MAMLQEACCLEEQLQGDVKEQGPSLGRTAAAEICAGIVLNCVPLIVFFFISFTTIVSEVHTMSQNCKSSYATATTRDANNNTLYHGGPGQGYGGRGYTPPSVTSNGKYQQMTTKVLFGNRHLDIGAEYVIRQYWKLRSDLERQIYCP
ncbi:unnamed protein product [Arctia plantaginis]|uniref:Uncharacterized protein n=1 Tax=Arctia plantaginis TaxID=874455 RepID=A0A8S1AW63_ARCPL|nr:unnamed protein product [Arctia plantaginis]